MLFFTVLLDKDIIEKIARGNTAMILQTTRRRN